LEENGWMKEGKGRNKHENKRSNEKRKYAKTNGV
jgi:hypothetical protein